MVVTLRASASSTSIPEVACIRISSGAPPYWVTSARKASRRFSNTPLRDQLSRRLEYLTGRCGDVFGAGALPRLPPRARTRISPRPLGTGSGVRDGRRGDHRVEVGGVGGRGMRKLLPQTALSAIALRHTALARIAGVITVQATIAVFVSVLAKIAIGVTVIAEIAVGVTALASAAEAGDTAPASAAEAGDTVTRVGYRSRRHRTRVGYRSRRHRTRVGYRSRRHRTRVGYRSWRHRLSRLRRRTRIWEPRGIRLSSRTSCCRTRISGPRQPESCDDGSFSPDLRYGYLATRNGQVSRIDLEKLERTGVVFTSENSIDNADQPGTVAASRPRSTCPGASHCSTPRSMEVLKKAPRELRNQRPASRVARDGRGGCAGQPICPVC